ncbi:MAG: transposase-like protein [Candidatus Nitrosomirales archaeon]|jgi:transposase-like protein
MEILGMKRIVENNDGSFAVPSQTNNNIVYEVRLIETTWVCSCPDFENREIESCKHIYAVRFWIATNTFLQNKPKPKVFSEDTIQCDRCGSIKVINYGKSSGKQSYYCNDCKHKFTPSLIKKAKYSPEVITLTLDLYFSGLSLRKIARSLNDHLDMNLGSTSIYRWIQRYVPMISEYTKTLCPQLSETWHADELFVKMKGGVSIHKNKGMAFLWNVMDRKTRFLLASKLSTLRDKQGAFAAFKEARANSHGDFPEMIFVDALSSYANVQHANIKGWNPKLIAKAGMNKPHANNNRIERLNGTLRERVKVQRGWKSMKSQLAEGQRIQYNFVKPHMALEGQTPAERAGIKIQGKNKWMTLIQNANKQI